MRMPGGVRSFHGGANAPKETLFKYHILLLLLVDIRPQNTYNIMTGGFVQGEGANMFSYTWSTKGRLYKTLVVCTVTVLLPEQCRPHIYIYIYMKS